ncbi:hypothetical protein K461DRAFT_311003 [Myriangium duriaei CBS 260.36]|uniref:ABM domain-containing protein n=1 Tax=Myriangium duriaei CBS 260.36 TaxID=1168546 RepID=A0A9P4J4Q2_9PEZI|nr:hypothetical protein K461DRAFT_311003 [Myriangium duriaei CBS 260.36]
MARKEIVITALIEPAPDKLERFKTVTQEAISWIKANEPDTLEFSLYETSPEHGEDGPTKFILVERYASYDAVLQHEKSDNYKTFFKKVTEEQLLAGAPVITRGGHVTGFRR